RRARPRRSPKTVGKFAHVIVGVHRLAAQGAHGTARAGYFAGALGESARRADGDADYERLLGFYFDGFGYHGGELIDAQFDIRERLDDDLPGGRIPPEAERADTELLVDGLLEGVIICQLGRRQRGNTVRIAVLGHQIVKYFFHAVGDLGGLFLFQRDANELIVSPRLQVERPRSGLTQGAHNKTVGPVETVDTRTHIFILGLTGCRGIRDIAASHLASGRRGIGAGIRCDPCQISDVRIHCYDVRTVSGVRDYRDRCGIHDKALEMVEMASQRIGQNRFNDVSVTDRGPHGTFTVTGIELGGARTYCRYGAKLH